MLGDLCSAQKLRHALQLPRGVGSRT